MVVCVLCMSVCAVHECVHSSRGVYPSQRLCGGVCVFGVCVCACIVCVCVCVCLSVVVDLPRGFVSRGHPSSPHGPEERPVRDLLPRDVRGQGVLRVQR